VETTCSSKWKSAGSRSGWILSSNASSLAASRSWNEILGSLAMALAQLGPEIVHQRQHPELLEGTVGLGSEHLCPVQWSSPSHRQWAAR